MLCVDPPVSLSNGIKMVIGATSVNNVADAGILSIVPNPSKGSFTVSGNMGAVATDYQISVMNVLGQKVHVSAHNTVSGTISELVTLPAGTVPGIYLVTVTSMNGAATFQLVVEK
jgi:hypothetical protein